MHEHYLAMQHADARPHGSTWLPQCMPRIASPARSSIRLRSSLPRSGKARLASISACLRKEPVLMSDRTGWREPPSSA